MLDREARGLLRGLLRTRRVVPMLLGMDGLVGSENVRAWASVHC